MKACTNRLYTQPQLLACPLLKEHLRLDYRGAQGLLELSDGPRAALSLRQAPDHSTLWRFARHKVTPGLLQQALAETVRPLEGHGSPGGSPPGGAPDKGSAKQVALDSTGLFLHHTSRYYGWRARRGYGQRWKAETLMSVLKRKWGECLSAGRATMQQLQALLRGVVYNLHRLTVLGVFRCAQLWLRALLQRATY